MNQVVYMDYAATTPVLPQVVARMAEVLALPLGNAAANHAAGQRGYALVEAARAQVAALIHAQARDVVFTSGATEANNLAIFGTARAAQSRGLQPHVVTLATEHKSVLEPVRALVRQGGTATILKPASDGLLAPDALAAALQPHSCLVSLLHVNNETGVAQHLPALREVCSARGVPLHIDACQSAGKLPVDVTQTALLSLTAHKFGGPQGIGALYVAPGHRGSLQSQILGGSHEQGLRAGTLAVHQIAGFGLAAELARIAQPQLALRLAALRERLWQGLCDLPDVQLNGHPAARVPGILNLTFGGVEGESLFTGLPELVIATGSACNSRSAEPSYVLRALGRDTQQAQGSLRFSLGWASSEADVDRAIAAVRKVHGELWAESPAQPLPLAAGVGETWVGEAGGLRLGTWVRFVLQAEGDTVKDSRVQVYGCPHTVAASRRVARALVGRPLNGLAAGAPEGWRVAVGAPVEKLGRMLIIEDALAALRPA